MNFTEQVKEAARTLNLLDEGGKLVALDSLSVLDLVNELERVTGISIPTSEIQAEAFASIESIAQLVGKLKAA